MNSQTKIVIGAFVAGLAAAGVGSLISGGIMPDHVSHFDTDTHISEWVGEKIGQLCLSPLIFAAVAIAATARSASLRSSVLNALAVVAAVIAIAAPIVYAGSIAEARLQGLPMAEAGKTRDAFVKGAIRTCTRTQQADPQNSGIPAATIEAFCSCVGNALADVTTRADVAFINQHQTPGPGYAEKSDAASQKCAQVVQDQK
jgi:hypothetical protein